MLAPKQLPEHELKKSPRNRRLSTPVLAALVLLLALAAISGMVATFSVSAASAEEVGPSELLGDPACYEEFASAASTNVRTTPMGLVSSLKGYELSSDIEYTIVSAEFVWSAKHVANLKNCTYGMVSLGPEEWISRGPAGVEVPFAISHWPQSIAYDGVKFKGNVPPVQPPTASGRHATEWSVRVGAARVVTSWMELPTELYIDQYADSPNDVNFEFGIGANSIVPGKTYSVSYHLVGTPPENTKWAMRFQRTRFYDLPAIACDGSEDDWACWFNEKGPDFNVRESVASVSENVGDTSWPPSHSRASSPGTSLPPKSPGTTIPDRGGSSERDVLRIGDSGPTVRELQRQISRHSYGIPDDGDFGPKTEEALSHFQYRYGLDDDGVAGGATWTALDGEILLLKKGAKGIAVERLQLKLAEIDGLNLESDGDFGNATRDAVRHFQRNVDLNGDGSGGDLVADGVVGRSTFNALYGNYPVRN